MLRQCEPSSNWSGSQFLLLMVAILFGVAFIAPSAAAQSRSFYWERWDVVIDNIDTTQNRFDVAEIYTIDFSGTFRFGTALIPMDRLSDITDVQVYQDGVLLEQGCGDQPGTVCVRNASDGKSILYYFRSPVTDQDVDIRLEYTVRGALRSYEGGDQLSWFAVTDDHAASVRSSSVVINLPPDAVPRVDVDPTVTYGVQTEIDVCETMGTCAGVPLSQYISEIEPGGAVVATRAVETIGIDQPLEIRIQYPHNPEMQAPPWQAAFDQQRAFEENIQPLLNLGIVVVSLLIGIGGPLGVFALYYTRGRDPHVGPVPEYLSEPPSDLPPAVAGTLVDERADLRDVLSTLIDLAHRGYLVIEEDRNEGLLFGIGASSEFTLKRTGKDTDDLLPFEKKIVRHVFGRSMEKSLDSLKNKFYRYLPDIQKQLYQELLRHKFFNANPDTTRNIWRGIGLVLAVGAFIGFMFVLGNDDNAELLDLIPLLPILPVAVGFTGLVLLVFSNFMPAKTRSGAEEAARWNAFRNYLRNLEQYDEVESAAEHFDRYLPYAVAFDLDKTWLRKFQNISSSYVPMPTWYYPRYVGGRWSRGYSAGSGPPSHADMMPGNLASESGGFSLEGASEGVSAGLESMSEGLSNMLDSTARVLSSKPSSSGSGGGFSGGGGGSGGSSGGGSRGFG